MKFVFVLLCLSFGITPAWSQDLESVLSKVLAHHSNLIDLANKARGNLQDIQLKAFNERLLDDYKVGRKTLFEMAEELNIEINDKELKEEIRPLKLPVSDERYINYVEAEQQKILAVLKNEFIPAIENSIFKEVSKNFLPRINKMLKNSEKLQRELIRDKIRSGIT